MRLSRLSLLLWPALANAQAPDTLVVGSKTFTESYLLAEIFAQTLEARGFEVERQFGFGGTRVTLEALRVGEIDVYPEYTGTISQTILESVEEHGTPGFDAGLEALGLEALAPLGFDNTYALTVTAATAERLNLQRISDLAMHPELRFGLSHEFRDRRDGWPALKSAYDLPQTSFGIEHGLAYRALLAGDLDVTDAYSTDADLVRYDLAVLADDRGFFPQYLAVPLVRRDLPAAAKTALRELGGRFDDATMRELNSQVAVGRRSFGAVSAEFLENERLVEAAPTRRLGVLATMLGRNVAIHLKLTGIAVGAACVIGVGLALTVYRNRGLSAAVLYAAGLLQTIPSIALLALMIPLAGVGQVPAIIALFLYSLLPIVRNAITALTTIDPLLRTVAVGIGLSQWEQLRWIYVPLALPHVLAGIRVAAVISIGTATLAAFIGAGGLGEPIVTGLALNDTGLILQGAIPAAILALVAELGFELAERRLVPAHLKASS
jgi:osmoprotectant transport system permease protein